MASVAQNISADSLSELSDYHDDSIARQPNYWAKSPQSLLSTFSTSDGPLMVLGTGSNVFRSMQPILEATESELILVTCFWAKSPSRAIVSSVLRHLSKKALAGSGQKIKVSICLSSVSLLQKLLHTQSDNGYIYPPSSYISHLGLPGPGELTGLDLSVKSIFIKPFSVMHPKFIIIDRRLVLLPSCNVSWEDWFEGCIRLQGDVVGRFVDFWQHWWAPERSRVSAPGASEGTPAWSSGSHLPSLSSEKGLLATLQSGTEEVQGKCVFLPSPHTVNPRFRPFPWQRPAPWPRTPLNVFVLTCLRKAERKVYLQTPNLTSPPVLRAVIDTLRRGVDVHIVTSERLMILEQLVTAGTTTKQCVKRLVKRYETMRGGWWTGGDDGPHAGQRLMEEGAVSREPGRLRIEYYVPSEASSMAGEPVQSHLKLTIVDDQLVVLGSGNMDRASWYTSQELGVAFESSLLATQLTSTLANVLRTRTKIVFNSNRTAAG